MPNYEREGAEGEDAEMHDAAAAQAGGAEEDATMTDAGGAAAPAAAAGEEEGEAVIEEVAPVVKEPTKITAQKFNYIRVRGVLRSGRLRGGLNYNWLRGAAERKVEGGLNQATEGDGRGHVGAFLKHHRPRPPVRL